MSEYRPKHSDPLYVTVLYTVALLVVAGTFGLASILLIWAGLDITYTLFDRLEGVVGFLAALSGALLALSLPLVLIWPFRWAFDAVNGLFGKRWG